MVMNKLPEWNFDATDVFIDEVAQTTKRDIERQTILASEQFVEREFYGKIPCGVGTTFSIKGCFSLLLVKRVAGD